MKNRVYIKDLGDHIGKKVLVQGFAETIRDQNKIAFVILRDITGKIQCVVNQKVKNFDLIRQLSQESVLEISGEVKEEKQAPNGYEIKIEDFNILSEADPELPIPVNIKVGEEANQNTRFDNRWLDLRRSEKSKIIKTWNSLEKGFRKYYDDNGYTQFYAPSLMSTPSESGAEVFEVKYFDRKAYLAQSPQFYKQMAIAAGFERVFAMGPVFRAEESFTTRHMTEFTGWDFEIGYVESHHDVMDEEEAMIVQAFEVLSKDMPEIEIEVPKRPFPRISVSEAKKILKKHNITGDKEHDLSPEEERVVGEIIKEDTGSDFLFLIDYHKSARAFYHMRHEDNPELTKGADLIYRGLEITTLAQREHRYSQLNKQAEEANINTESLKHYLNFFRYGCPPHGGGGIGANRLVMKVLELENVKEATFLPRDVNRLDP